MSVLDRKLLRDLRHSKGSLAGILGIIMVGIACFVAMSSSYFNLDGALSRYYARSQMADFWVSLKKLPASEMDALANIEGIAELHGRISFQLTVDLDDEPKPLTAQLVSLPDTRKPVLNDIVMMRGSYFSEGRRDEVIVNEAFAKERKLSPGDRIHVLLNNRRQELTIVGTAISAEFIYLISAGSIVPDPKNYGILYMPHRHAEEVFDFDGAYNQIVGTLTPAFQDKPELVLHRIEQILEPYGVASATPRSQFPSHRFISDEINGLRVSAAVMPAIFLSVAALVLNVLMTRLAEQQRTIIGTLKAIGYSNGQMIGHFLKFGVIVGGVGGVLGCLLGYAMAEGMIVMYRMFFQFPNLINRPYPLLFSIGVSTGLLFAVVGTLRGVSTIMKLNPAESMRPSSPVSTRGVFLERFQWLWPRLGFRWHMVIRDLFRQRGRTLAGLFAATMGAALLILCFLSRDAVQFLVDFQFKQLLRSDIDLHFKDARGIRSLHDARDLPNVGLAEPLFTVPCDLKNGIWTKKLAITALRPGATLTIPRDIEGKAVQVPQVGLLLSRSLAEMLHVRPGELLFVEPTEGNREPRIVPVTQIVDGYLGMSAYADFSYLNRIMEESQAISSVQLRLNSQLSPTDLYHELKQLPALQAAASIRDEKANLEHTFIETMKVSLTIMILFAGAIFFGSILNSSLVALAERKREIATFRVVGYGPWEIGMIFLRESLAINLIGTAIGIPLGFYLNSQIAKLYSTELFRMPVVMSPSSVVWTIILAVLFTTLAHAIIQRQIHIMDWRDALNARE